MRRTTKVFAAAEVFATSAMGTTMPMPTAAAFGHRSLSTQTYQRTKCKGDCKYFDKVRCHKAHSYTQRKRAPGY
jgi:hypothetical protein